MRYIFRCKSCGASFEAPYGTSQHGCGGTAVRNWKAEAAAPAVANLRKEREGGGKEAIRDRFLPTTKDFASASDPDGEKGMRTWLDEHGPRSSNNRPLYPEHKKVMF